MWLSLKFQVKSQSLLLIPCFPYDLLIKTQHRISPASPNDQSTVRISCWCACCKVEHQPVRNPEKNVCQCNYEPTNILGTYWLNKYRIGEYGEYIIHFVGVHISHVWNHQNFHCKTPSCTVIIPQLTFTRGLRYNLSWANIIELVQGKIYRKPPYLMVKTMVSCKIITSFRQIINYKTWLFRSSVYTVPTCELPWLTWWQNWPWTCARNSEVCELNFLWELSYPWGETNKRTAARTPPRSFLNVMNNIILVKNHWI